MLFECAKLGKKLQKSPKTRKKQEKNTCEKNEKKKAKFLLEKKFQITCTKTTQN